MHMAFHTDRLTACIPTENEAICVTALLQEEAVVKMLARMPWPYSETDYQVWLEKSRKDRQAGSEYAFLLHHASYGVVGSVGMQHVAEDIWEIGYWIGKPFWGQGFVSEAAQGLIRWAEENLSVTRFVSGHIVDNPASGRVLEKLGFHPVGRRVMYVRGRDGEVEALRYTLNAPSDIALQGPGHGPS